MYQHRYNSTLRILLALAISTPLATTQTHLLSPPKIYRDTQFGITFQYPATWNIDNQRAFYVPAQILYPDRQPLTSIGFGGSPANKFTPYPNTNLSGVQFIYVVLPKTTPHQCEDAVQSSEEDKITREVINGITYRHISSGSAGMCHQVDEQIYSAFHRGRCYLFDSSIQTVCEGVIDGARNITPAETDHVKAQLKQVMQSVRINDSK